MTKRERLIELIRSYSYREGEFLLASGKKSRFYVDMRRTALHPEGALLIGHALYDVIRERGWTPDGVGGMTLGADPLTTATSLVSLERGTPWSGFLVRKEPKDHGTGKQVESAGSLSEGDSVVVLDDTVTTGGSTLKAIKAVEQAGFRVLGAACVVNRDEGGTEKLAESGYELLSVLHLPELGAGKA